MIIGCFSQMKSKYSQRLQKALPHLKIPHCLKIVQIGVFLVRTLRKMRENTEQKNSVFGHFSRSACDSVKNFVGLELSKSGTDNFFELFCNVLFL